MNLIKNLVLLTSLLFGLPNQSRRRCGNRPAGRFFRPGSEGIDLEDRTVLSPMLRYPLDPAVVQSNIFYYDNDKVLGQLKDWNGGTKTYDDPATGYNHAGTDFTVPNLSKVYAAAAGTVLAVRDGVNDGDKDAANYGTGNYVKIQHAGGIISLYFHLSKGSLKVTNGQQVSMGQEIGAVGLSGNTTGYHLHFETRSSDSTSAAFDPYKGSGNPITESWWLDQGPYLGKPGVASAPTNDNFASRAAISSSGGTVTGSNVGATQQSGEPNPAGVSGTHSVWWTWTAPASGTATISTAGSNFDTTLGVYTGTSVSSLTRVADNDDANGTVQSQVTFTASAGTTYQIQVNGYGSSTGKISLGVSLSASASPPSAPSNVTASAISSSQVAVSWQDNSGNEQGFRVYRWTGSWTLVATVGANVRTYTDSNLQPSSTYYYTITAYNNAGETWASNYATVTTQAATVTPPAAPTNVVWRATSSTSGYLTWSDNSNNELGFRMQYWSGSSWVTFDTLGAGSTTSRTYGVQAGATYYLRVAAYNNAGETASTYITVRT